MSPTRISDERFRTLLFYLRHHRVSVGLMIEVATVSVVRELLINPPGTSAFDSPGISLLLVVLGILMVADRVTPERGNARPGWDDDDPTPPSRTSPAQA